MVKKKGSKIQKNSRFLLFVVGLLIFSVLGYLFFLNESSDSKAIKSLSSIGSNLETQGFNGTITHECGIDDSRKFDSRKVCQTNLSYARNVEEGDLGSELGVLVGYFDKQTFYHVEDSLSENRDVGLDGEHTYSSLVDNSSAKRCSLNINTINTEKSVSVRISCVD